MSDGACRRELAASRRFARIAGRSACPFARSGKHVAAPEWRIEASWLDNAARVAEHLSAVLALESSCWDGYVVDIPLESSPDSVAELGRLVRDLLGTLASLDPNGKNCMALPVETKGWWFRFGPVRFFVLALSSLYPDEHSRSTRGLPGTFVVFQPEHAFDRALGKLDIVTAQLRSNVRKAFEAQGQAYDPSISESPYEVHRYVKPLQSGAPVVRWWRAD
jgi:hypothetical protein